MRSFALAALVGTAVAFTPSSMMDCQKIVSVTNGVAVTDLNPAGVKLPDGFVIGNAKNLCVAPRGQFCERITARRCVVNGKVRFAAKNCEYKQGGALVTAPQRVSLKDGSKMELTSKQAQITGTREAVCFHAPQDHVVKANECQVRFNYRLADGSMYRWAVSSGQHNVPTVKGALDSLVVAGKGCIALRYSEKDAKGRAMPVSEGYHARFPVEVRSIQVLPPRSKVCLAGEELVATGKGDTCVPCKAGYLSAKGDNKCHKAEICSHVTCRAVTPGSTFKKCKSNTYKSLKHDKFGGFSWMFSDNDAWRCNEATAQGFFLHVFHHGNEAKGTHHRCENEAGKCVCRCFTSEMAFAPPKADCKATLTNAIAAYKAGTKISENICFGQVKAAISAARCLDEVPAAEIRKACALDSCKCTKMVKPVRCASNSMTYANKCLAGCAKATKCTPVRTYVVNPPAHLRKGKK